METKKSVGPSVPGARDPADRSPIPRAPLYSSQDDKVSLLLFIELPGVSTNKIDLEVSDHDLLVTATTDPYAKEYCYKYSGALTLQEEIEPNNAEAQYEDGLLRVVLPKVRAAAPKRRKLAISDSRTARK